MLTLAINTACFWESIALLKGKKALGEITWLGQHDETKKLLPNIKTLLKKTGKQFSDIKRIIVVAGPGGFSSTRIGAAVANVLANSLKAELFSVNSVDLWKIKRLNKNAILALHAGGSSVFIETLGGDFKKKGVFAAENAFCLPQKSLLFFGDLTQNELAIFRRIKQKNWRLILEKNLTSFAQAVLLLPSRKIKKTALVKPVYWRPANITKPKLHKYVS